MTPDQLRLEEAHAWLARARGDLEAANLLTVGGAYAEALFHCQQIVEKALKAFLAFHQKAFRRTHDLGELSPECVSIDDSLQSVLEQAKVLTKYAWEFRYPGAPYEPDTSEASDALRKAEAALLAIEHRIPPVR